MDRTDRVLSYITTACGAGIFFRATSYLLIGGVFGQQELMRDSSPLSLTLVGCGMAFGVWLCILEERRIRANDNQDNSRQ